MSDTFDTAWVTKMVSELLRSCHPKQRAFVEDPHRRVSVLCGRRAGKTTAVRARLVIEMVRTPRARCVFIASTRKSAKDLMWGSLKDVMGALGIECTWNETELTCRIKRNGATLMLVGCDDRAEVNKLRGQKFHHVAIDEAANFPTDLLEELIYRVIAPALGDHRGVLTLIGTPGHQLRGPFYDATRPGSDSHRPYDKRDEPEYAGWKRWSSHAWSALDGAPFIPSMANAWAEMQDTKAEKQWGDDHPTYMRETLGIWAIDATENVYRYAPHKDGKAWNQWDPVMREACGVRIAMLPVGFDHWEFVVGIDLGHNDPTAITVWAFAPADASRTIYQVFEFEKKEQYAKTIAELLLGPKVDHDHPSGVIGAIGTYPSGMVADAAGLGDSMLDELRNVYGLSVAPAAKGYKYKFGAIETVNGDLVEGRLKILKGSELEKQLQSLQWIEDQFGQLKECRTQRNDLTDSMVYARLVISNLFESGAVDTTPKRASGDPTYQIAYREDENGMGNLLGDSGEYRDPMGLD